MGEIVRGCSSCGWNLAGVSGCDECERGSEWKPDLVALEARLDEASTDRLPASCGEGCDACPPPNDCPIRGDGILADCVTDMITARTAALEAQVRKLRRINGIYRSVVKDVANDEWGHTWNVQQCQAKDALEAALAQTASVGEGEKVLGPVPPCFGGLPEFCSDAQCLYAPGCALEHFRLAAALDTKEG